MTLEIEIVRIPVDPARMPELVSVLEGARDGYLAGPACVGVELLTSADSADVAAIVRWSSAQAHEAALRSMDAALFFKAVMGLASGPPEVRKYAPVAGDVA